MVVFGVVVDDCPAVRAYAALLNKRVADDNLVKNPFVGRVVGYNIGDKKRLLAVSIRPIYFNFSVFGWVVAAMYYMIWGWNPYAFVPAVMLGCMGFFWTASFYRLIMRIGLRRNKYRGKVRAVGAGKALEMVLSVRR